jgi:predicted type IV restriction endonuclease
MNLQKLKIKLAILNKIKCNILINEALQSILIKKILRIDTVTEKNETNKAKVLRDDIVWTQDQAPPEDIHPSFRQIVLYIKIENEVQNETVTAKISLEIILAF